MTTLSIPVSNTQLWRKQERHNNKDYKKNKKEEIKLDNINISNDVKSQKNNLNDKLTDIRKKIKFNNNTKYKNIETEISYKISECDVLILKLDNNFMTRNMIRTQMCPKVLKNKECKYNECLFAHTLTDIRKTKCMANIYNICSYGNSCKHDHSNSELPEFPVKPSDEVQPKEVTLEDILLSGLNTKVLSLIGEYLIGEYL